MNRKKVAVLLPWLKMGGTNKVALRFINELKEYCDVTLILSQNTGELLNEVPEDVDVIIDEMVPFKKLVKNDLKKFHFINLIKDVIYYAKIKAGKDSIDNYKYIVQRNSIICNKEFDCAISYHGQSPERLLNLIYRIKSKKKVAWIHGEMSFSKKNCKLMEKYYNMMDHFFFVSNPTKESFAKAIAFDRTKATVYYNPLNKNEIINKSQESMDVEFSKEYTNIVTVGRVSSEKGQDMIPVIMKQLETQEYKVRWYIIGDGPDFEKIQRLITENKVENSVFMLGVKNNPYPYMSACDIYVQPSYTEGYSTTICEAGILGKAIIGTTPSGGIKDQISHMSDGMIVDAKVDSLIAAVELLIKDEDQRQEFELNIQKKNFEGKGEINKFLSFIYK